jgi:hypothetical protein
MTQAEAPKQFRGGILADEMGLGKTLSMLALLAAAGTPKENCTCLNDWDVLDGIPVATGTLIVMPLSCKYYQNTDWLAVSNFFKYLLSGIAR